MKRPTLPAGPVPVALQEIGAGLGFPLYLTSPPGDERLFIVEKGGTIRIRKPGGFVAEPFLDISGQITADGEQGLLGLAFPPRLRHVREVRGALYRSRGRHPGLAFQVSTDPDAADPLSETVLLAEDQPFSNHKGGQITFGPDGFLYIGLGDGGSGGDPGDRAQRLDELLGSILRIDMPDPRRRRTLLGPGGQPLRPDPERALRDLELWAAESVALLLRSGHWRSLHRRRRPERVGRGELVAGRGGRRPRGQLRVEPDGRPRTATRRTRAIRTGLVLPILEYGHDNIVCSVTGGYVYRGTAIPALQGHYFYGDFCGGFVRSFRVEGGAAVDESTGRPSAPGGPSRASGRTPQGSCTC